MDKQTRKAQVGSISTGTLVTQDLIEAFESELEYLGVPFDCHNPNECDDTDHLDYLTALLEEQAPDYCYFGTLEGDGADFGFWPSETVSMMARFSRLAMTGTRFPPITPDTFTTYPIMGIRPCTSSIRMDRKRQSGNS